MKVVKMSCPNCGGKLEITDSKKNIIYSYCEQSLFLDDEKTI